jgi:hypothetical protein
MPKVVFDLIQSSLILYLYGEKLCICGFAEVLSAKDKWVCKLKICKISKIAEVCNSKKIQNSKKSLQNCRFAICGTYLQTASLWCGSKLIYYVVLFLTQDAYFKLN